MLRRINLTPDRARLLASLAFNFAAKAPGLVATLFILPMISRSLGTATYGEFLSALALGSIFTLPFGGVNVVGRRLLGGAFGAGDQGRQADIFVTTTLVMAGIAVLASVVALIATIHSWTKTAFVFVSLLPIGSTFLNGFDNVRASYNEHYITAILQLIFQVLVYGSVYAFGLPEGSIVFAGLALQSPYALASIATLILLLQKRPFLLKGRVEALRGFLLPAVGVILADGALALLLNLSIYYLQASRNAYMAAWFGTLVRLFQGFMSPVLLILFPVTTYIAMKWGSLEPRRQRLLHKVFIWAGFSYGALVGFGMAILGPLYVDRMFKLAVHGDSLDVIALSLFLGTVIAQKTYTMLLYSVSEARFVSFGTATVAVLSIGVAAVSGLWLSSERVVVVLFIAVSLGVPLVLFLGDHRYRHQRPNLAAPS